MKTRYKDFYGTYKLSEPVNVVEEKIISSITATSV
ncbi:MAG: hypothetical protein J6X89_03750 [Bacteroidales bacterium]|nr:hypothetical protein [Bacteroidales bacterium]